MEFEVIERAYDSIVALQFYLFVSCKHSLNIKIDEDILNTIKRTTFAIDYIHEMNGERETRLIIELKELRGSLIETIKLSGEHYWINQGEIALIEEARNLIQNYVEQMWKKYGKKIVIHNEL